MRVVRFAVLCCASSAALAASLTGAAAGAFGLREQSAAGLGQAFAGAASGEAGLGSMFWNPATVTMRPGWQSESNVTYVDPDVRIRTDAPTPTLGLGQSGEIGLSGTIPASYTAYQLNEHVWLGLAATAPFGLITKPNTVWAGQTYSRSSKVFSANFAPIIGIKVTDWLSIGAGPTIQYFKTRLNSASAASPLAGNVILEGDSVAVGVTAGATITPFAGTVIGVGYRSTLRQEVEGTLRTPLAVLPARVNLNLPDQLTFGVTQTLTPDLKASFGFEWTNWSRLKLPGVVLAANGAPVAAVPLGYKDGYYFSLGAEYQWDPRWAFRAGLAYEISPVDQSNRGTRLPDTDRIHLAVGASYKYSDRLEFAASYAHLFGVGNRTLRIVPGNIVYNALPFFGSVDADVNIFGVSANYRWDDTRVAEAAPIIRKY